MGKYGVANLEGKEGFDTRSKGGKKAHELGKAHTWSSEEAKKAAFRSALARQTKPCEKCGTNKWKTKVKGQQWECRQCGYLRKGKV